MTSPDSAKLASIVESAHPRRRWRWRIVGIIGLIALIVAGWLIFGPKKDANAEGPRYETQPVQRGDISLTITATGNLEPTNEVTVGSELSGTVLEVYVDTNDKVTKGQPLLKLDTSILQQETESSRASLRSAQAQVAQAKATLREAEAALARQDELKKLSGGKLPSKADYEAATAAADRARADLLVSEASVGQAEARVKVNESDLGKAIIKSPIDGIVLTRDIEPGQTVAASFTAPELFVIAENLEHMKLLVTVAEADIGRLKEGQPATFTVDAWPDRTYDATVTKVAFGSTTTDNVVTYETELEVSNDDLSLRPGMTATADIRVAESKGALIVPAAALRFNPAAAQGPMFEKRSFVQSLTPMPPRRRRDNGPKEGEGEDAGKGSRSHVWTLKDGEPAMIPVRTGLVDGGRMEVISDKLKEGTPVILRSLH